MRYMNTSTMMSKDAPKAAQSSSSFGSTIKALNPGPIFRTVVGLYADRKFLLLVSFHVVATLICYGKKNMLLVL